MQHLINNIYYVEVPEGAHQYWLGTNTLQMVTVLWYNKFDGSLGYTTLKGLGYTIIGTGKEVLQSEELAKQVVEMDGYMYKDYRNEYGNFIGHFYPTHSARSLFTAHDVPNNILLLKKND